MTNQHRHARGHAARRAPTEMVVRSSRPHDSHGRDARAAIVEPTAFAVRRRRPTRAPRRGFTLIETALATIIVGVGVLAMMAAQQAFHQQNRWSMLASTGMQLGNEIREMTLTLPRHDPVTGDATWGPEAGETWVGDFDDLDDFDGEGAGLVFSAALGNGPLNARRENIPNMDGWAQTVIVQNVDPFDITSAQADGSTNMIRVEVLVTYQSAQDAEPMEVTRVSWIAPD